MMKEYCVHYRMRYLTQENAIFVTAQNKQEAYDKAAFEYIPRKEGAHPYSVWVVSVTYSNGRYHRFNTCEGLPY
jgi:hypothetical protein